MGGIKLKRNNVKMLLSNYVVPQTLQLHKQISPTIPIILLPLNATMVKSLTKLHYEILISS